jgi:hypothetical protein
MKAGWITALGLALAQNKEVGGHPKKSCSTFVKGRNYPKIHVAIQLRILYLPIFFPKQHKSKAQ